MARTVLAARVQVGQAYTVPNGKYAVFAAHPTETIASPVIIGSVTIAIVSFSSNTADFVASPAKPLTAAAGQVISTTGSGAGFGLSGFLYDV